MEWRNGAIAGGPATVTRIGVYRPQCEQASISDGPCRGISEVSSPLKLNLRSG
jgi:hypothetical protein